jgi:spore germination protein (amino acid permease)
MFDQVAPKGMVLFAVGLALEATLLMQPAPITEVAGPDVWLAAALTVVALIALALLGVWVASHFRDESFVQYAPRLLGTWPAQALVLVLTFYWLGKLAEASVVASRMVQIYLLPRTPVPAVVVILLASAIYLARLGIGPAIRFAELTVPLLVAIILLAMVVALPGVHFSYLRPVLHHGWRPVVKAAADSFPHSQGYEVLLLLYPFLSRKRAAPGVIVLVGLVRLVVSEALLLVTVGVLSVPDTIRQVFPVLAVTRSVELQGIGLERLDSLFMAVWLVASFLPIAFRLYLISLALAQLFGRRDHRPFVWPVALAGAALTAVPRNPLQFERLRREMGWLGAAALVGVPVLLALALLVRGTRGRGTRRVEP